MFLVNPCITKEKTEVYVAMYVKVSPCQIKVTVEEQDSWREKNES